MKNLKKLAVWLLMVTLVFSLAGCSAKEEEDSKDDRTDRVERQEDDADDTKEEDEESADSKDAEEDAEVKEDSKDEATEPVEEVVTESEMTALELVEKMMDAMEGKTITSMTNSMDIQMSMAIKADGMSMNMDLNMVADGENLISTEPYIAYSTMEMTVDMMGQQVVESSETYVLEEDGELVNYTYSGSTGQWQKVNSGMSIDDLMPQMNVGYDWLWEKTEDDFTLAPETQTINGREVYVLGFTMTGDDLQSSMNGMAGFQDMLAESGLDGLDMTSMNVPAVYYIDAETYMVAQMEMNIEGMGEMMDSMMSELLGTEPSMAGYEMDINIGTCRMVYENISYDPVEIPALPEEARMLGSDLPEEEPGEEYEEEPYFGDIVVNEDGSYTIEESGAKARVICQEGWTVSYTAYDTISMENDETWMMVDCTMYVDVSSQHFVDYVETVEVSSAQSAEMYISHEKGPEISGYETIEMICDGIYFYFAWAPVGDGHILVTVVDFDCLGIEEALPAVLDCVVLDAVL